MIRPSYFWYWSLLVQCVIGLSPLGAQHYPYIRYTTDDGLPTNYVYGVVEDEDGYIWAYTENGLAKFDGYEWEHFTTENGLPGNDVVLAQKAPDGKIWLWMYRENPAYLYRDSIYQLGAGSCVLLDIQYDGNPYYSCNGKSYLYEDSLQYLPTSEIDQWALDYFGDQFEK
ncbi:MAG: two-component regulator propeller domain-containing protein, partial [Bacteroidota bacterium]